MKIVFQASAKDFEKIPGAPIVYWLPPILKQLFASQPNVNDFIKLREGIHTSDNALFLRFWPEVSFFKFSFLCSSIQDIDNRKAKWIPYNKGGSWRKWFGNNELVISFDTTSREKMANSPTHVRPSQDLYFKSGATWSALSNGHFCLRYYPDGYLFDSKGQVAVGVNSSMVMALFNTNAYQVMASAIMPTLDYKCGDVKKLPYAHIVNDVFLQNAMKCVEISKQDWDSYEASWDFTFNLLIKRHINSLFKSFSIIRQHWTEMTEEMHRLEEENNRIFIEAYGLQDELSPDVPWNEITLTCNPWYRYGATPQNPTCKEFPVDVALEARLKADTMKEFLSYAVGCMFGRYSLDKPGLVLANQGETLADYLKQIPQPTFMPDEDNVLPILDEDWFADDIVTRFNEFLKTTFGEENFYENLAFIEEALGKDVRSYFLKDFYKDHLQRYHNHPIYWLFSSPKEAFNALVYMHRYRPETVGIVLTYLRSHITKVTERIHTLETTIDSSDSTAGMKSKAIRERSRLQKSLRELEDYERDVLYPLATEKIAIDLDDGVKVNYRKFGDALYKIKGLEAKEE